MPIIYRRQLLVRPSVPPHRSLPRFRPLLSSLLSQLFWLLPLALRLPPRLSWPAMATLLAAAKVVFQVVSAVAPTFLVGGPAVLASTSGNLVSPPFVSVSLPPIPVSLRPIPSPLPPQWLVSP
jgi:hypothetical protein